MIAGSCLSCFAKGPLCNSRRTPVYRCPDGTGLVNEWLRPEDLRKGKAGVGVFDDRYRIVFHIRICEVWREPRFLQTTDGFRLFSICVICEICGFILKE